MVYIISSAIIIILLIIIAVMKVKSSKTSVIENMEETSESKIVPVTLNKVHLIKDGESSTLENIFDSKIIDGYLTFIDKDNNKSKFKEGYITSYVIEPTGIYEKKVKAHIAYTPFGKQIEYY